MMENLNQDRHVIQRDGKRLLDSGMAKYRRTERIKKGLGRLVLLTGLVLTLLVVLEVIG